VQSHDKIAVKFYAEQANAKSLNFILKNLCGKISPPKARQKSAKKPKKPPQNPRDEISPANFFR